MKGAAIALLASCFIALIFFYQILLGKIPYPGDMLAGNYEPYKSLSYGGFVPGAIPNKAQGPDVVKEFLPWKKFAMSTLKSGSIPFWNPYNFSGNPLMANFQSGVFYPGNFIFFLFDFSKAWTLYIFIEPILSAYFTYLFLRRLKISSLASLFGGLAFAFSLYMTVWMEYGNIGHTLLWLPLALYFTERFNQEINPKNFLGLVFSLFFATLAGYIQGLFYIYAVVLFYFLFKGIYEHKLKVLRIGFFFLALIFPILLSLFQLLPTFELFSYSTRGNYSIEQIQNLLNPVWYLVTVAVPDFFGNPAARNFTFNGTYIERVSYFGLIPLIFALTAIFNLLKRIEVKIFSIILVITLLFTTDIVFTKFFYLIPIPMISTSVPTRMLSLFAFSGSILAAFGLDYAVKNKKYTFLIVLSLVIFVFLAGLFGFSTLANMDIARRNLIIPIVTIFVFIVMIVYFYKVKLLVKFKDRIFIAGIFAISILELFYYFQKITPFASKDYLYPVTPVVQFLQENAGINRFWGYGLGYIESNFQTFDGTYSPDGNDPLHIRNYTQLLASSKNGRVPDVLPRPDANIAGGFGHEDLANNFYRQKVLNITGVKYVLNKNEGLRGDLSPDETTFPRDRYKLLWQNGFWQVYENLQAVPRFFITNKYEVLLGNSALHKLFKPEFNERETLILSEDPQVPGGRLAQGLKPILYSPNKIVVNTKTSAPALLFLSDNYYPGWHAYVDGVESKIFLADYSFRAVRIPEGEHKVYFEFKPKNFYYGLYASIVGVVLLLYCCIAIKKYEI